MISEFKIINRIVRAYHLAAGDTFSVVYRDKDGKERTLLTEKITKAVTTEEVFIASMLLDGKQALVGGYTIKGNEHLFGGYTIKGEEK